MPPKTAEGAEKALSVLIHAFDGKYEEIKKLPTLQLEVLQLSDRFRRWLLYNPQLVRIDEQDIDVYALRSVMLKHPAERSVNALLQSRGGASGLSQDLQNFLEQLDAAVDAVPTAAASFIVDLGTPNTALSAKKQQRRNSSLSFFTDLQLAKKAAAQLRSALQLVVGNFHEQEQSGWANQPRHFSSRWLSASTCVLPRHSCIKEGQALLDWCVTAQSPLVAARLHSHPFKCRLSSQLKAAVHSVAVPELHHPDADHASSTHPSSTHLSIYVRGYKPTKDEQHSGLIFSSREAAERVEAAVHEALVLFDADCQRCNDDCVLEC